MTVMALSPLLAKSVRVLAGLLKEMRVLLIDDDAQLNRLTAFALRGRGISVVSTTTPDEGLRLAGAEDFDLVLLDVMMPELDGWSVARELTADERTRDIPFVFLTARADPADRRLGEQLGGAGYLVKPFDPVTIGDFVENVLVRVERGEREQLRRGISSERER